MKSKLKKDLFLTSTSHAPARKFIITVFVSCYFVTVLPIVYFLYKNYLVLDEIGFKFFPTLLDLNNQDKITLFFLCTLSFFLGLGIQLYAQSYFLKRLYGPIDLMQNHMSKLIQGEFNQNKITLKQEQYVHELIKTYNYLYGSLQTNLKRDITFLKELEHKYDPQLAHVLISEKQNQLGFSQNDSELEKNNTSNSEQAA